MILNFLKSIITTLQMGKITGVSLKSFRREIMLQRKPRYRSRKCGVE